MSLEISNLTKSYGNFIALDKVNLYVKAGEIVGILGPNGAGKSTLLRLCEGIEGFDEGRISFTDKDISIEKDLVKGNIGLVLQRPTFSSYSSVKEVISFFSNIKDPKFETTALARALELDIKFDSRIGKLSGGQRQRLAILIGLMWGPSLILLDEPTSELDPHGRRVVWDLIAKIAKESNSAVLISTHQMEEAELLCDRVYILDAGKVIASGTPAQIIYEHCKNITLNVSVNQDALYHLQEKIGEVDYSLHGEILRCSKNIDSIKVGKSFMKEVLNQIEFEVLDLALNRANLEDVFLHLTGEPLMPSLEASHV